MLKIDAQSMDCLKECVTAMFCKFSSLVDLLDNKSTLADARLKAYQHRKKRFHTVSFRVRVAMNCLLSNRRLKVKVEKYLNRFCCAPLYALRSNATIES